MGGTKAPDFERALNGLIVGRAPVDLAWARHSRPVLIALLAGLKGLYLDDVSSDVVENRIGELRSAEIANTWSAADDCHVAVRALLDCTGALESWSQWNVFCDTIPFTGTAVAVQAKRDILKANFNPNTDLNKFNPNPSLWKTVDKGDLLAYSTEFSLLSVQPLTLESVGRLMGNGGGLLAARNLRVTLSGPSVVRLGTQREFVCGNLGSLDLPGDETGVRLPGAAAFLSLNEGAGKAWGHRLANLAGKGAALQSYPEPCVDVGGSGTALSMSPADYDGNLQLATIETPTDALYTVTATTHDMKMLGRFDDGFDLTWRTPTRRIPTAGAAGRTPSWCGPRTGQGPPGRGQAEHPLSRRGLFRDRAFPGLP